MMVLAIPPKPVPKALRLHEAAARIVELEPFLDINEVRKRLSELVASGDLPAQSEIEDPGNDLAWSTFGARRAGFWGCTFAETWHLWLEKGATIEWESNAIFVPIAGRLVRIPLPRVEWDDVLRLFSPATSGVKEVSSGKTAPDSELKSWYEERVKNWPSEQNPPTSNDDWTAARAQFPEFKVTRDQIRKVRSKLASPKWLARGRRPDSPRPDKLANKLR
jgi:hypothetical protein